MLRTYNRTFNKFLNNGTEVKTDYEVNTKYADKIHFD